MVTLPPRCESLVRLISLIRSFLTEKQGPGSFKTVKRPSLHTGSAETEPIKEAISALVRTF